jgi:membrane associated rhomboid family serine protease
MTPTSVGMRCPECSREKTKVRTARTLTSAPYVTYVLIAVNALVYLGSTAAGGGLAGRGGGDLITRGGLFGPSIHIDHEYWRILTSGFLHAGFFHVAFNMYFLYVLGGMLEPALGGGRFLALYLISLVGGSLGALLVTPHALTVGASGACFGVLGGCMAYVQGRGGVSSIMESGLGAIALINLAFSVAIPGISIGGHIGGLVTGFVTGYLLIRLGTGRGRAPAAYGMCVVLFAALFAAAVFAAGRT